MPKTGKNIYKRKDGRWEGRYAKSHTINGKMVYGSVYGKTCTEVKQKLLAINVDENVLSAAVPEDSSITFDDIANLWLSEIYLTVKPSTYSRYTIVLESHILPHFGTFKIIDLQTSDINNFTREKMENGRADGKGGLSAKSVRDILSIIKTILDFGENNDIISNGPRVTYPKNHQQSIRVLSRQEQSLLEDVLTNDIDIHKLGILLCLYTGLRIGEICALRWQDISADFDVISVRQTLQRIKNSDNQDKKTVIIIDVPKSPNSIRDIPIPKFISPYLRSFFSDNHFYFLANETMDFTEPRTMQNHFARSIKATSIANANFHSLRHTFATRCIEAGVDTKSLSEMLGHSNVNITLERYVHSSFDQKRAGINKLEQYNRI